MKIAILYIAIGKYSIFWDDFFQSANRYINNAEVTFIVFSDCDIILSKASDKIKTYRVENFGWPGNTLYRYEIFLLALNELKKNDLCIFFNANLILSSEFDPQAIANENLFAACHPYYFNLSNSLAPFERDSRSLAYVPFGSEKAYIQGAFFGGKSEDFIQLCKTLSSNIRIDESNGIIAIWHDESHLNSYSNHHFIKTVDPRYVYPQEFPRFSKTIIISRDKRRFGGHLALRANHRKGNVYLINSEYKSNELVKKNIDTLTSRFSRSIVYLDTNTLVHINKSLAFYHTNARDRMFILKVDGDAWIDNDYIYYNTFISNLINSIPFADFWWRSTFWAAKLAKFFQKKVAIKSSIVILAFNASSNLSDYAELVDNDIIISDTLWLN